MYRFPQLKVPAMERQIVDNFKGYNHNLRIGDGEFYDMKNMTADHAPVLSVRKRRGEWRLSDNYIQGLTSKEELCYVDGSCFVVGGRSVDMGLSVDEYVDYHSGKQVVSMGAYAVIFPDGKYINTKTLEWGSIDAEVVTQEAAQISLCDSEGNAYENVTTGDTAPEAPENGTLWVDTELNMLKKYRDGIWIGIPQTYVKIASAGIGAGLGQYDGVEISGTTSAEGLNGSTVIYACGEDYIVVSGMIRENTAEEGSITVKRQAPLMDYVTESGNRLWGCRYGLARNGEFVNEIYCSKLGDFKNWSCYMGISTDSYTASCGTDGPFTGAVTHMGYPLFWKQNCVHKVYGKVPSNFRIQDTACQGVQNGSWRSLAIVGNVLYYKGADGVYAYDGSMPEKVSEKLGQDVYSFATACAHLDKYYLSAMGPEGGYLFAYDTQKRIWMKEDDTYLFGMASHQGNLYGVTWDMETVYAKSSISVLDGRNYAQTEAAVQWMAETGVIGASLPDSKYLTKIQIRMAAETGSTVRIFVEYDSMGGWLHAYTGTARNLRSFTIPIQPRRCDHLRVKIEGTGDARIFAITKIFMMGSDVT